MKMKNQVQLITYVDRLGCNTIQDLHALFNHELKDLFGGIHILPFYYPIDGEDAGFDPIDHTLIDPRLGDWTDLLQLSQSLDIMADIIVNHMSAQSAQFQNYLKLGDNSPYADLFLDYDTVFPNGASDSELAAIYRPRPSSAFTNFRFANGQEKLIWTSFTSNQVDIDVNSKEGIHYLDNILDTFHKAGITMIRLDAAGYAIKKQGTSCFMIEETFAFIEELSQKARAKGMAVLVEIHSYYKTQIKIAQQVDYVYDFALPVLVLDTLFNKNASNLKSWLEISPRNAVTVLDTHDGIGIVDVAPENGQPGLIEEDQLNQIVEQIHINCQQTSLKATGSAASNLDLYQVNCTYYDALGKDDIAYLMARAIQFFTPGIPQVYYVGLFSGENDMDLLQKTNVGRDINRQYFTKEDIQSEIERPIFKQLKKLIQFRNSHIAFDGTCQVVDSKDDILQIKWENNTEWAELKINLPEMQMAIQYSDSGKTTTVLELEKQTLC